jgi:hypothetical protein
MTKLRFALPLLALVTMVMSSGCLVSRKIVHLEDHPTANVTLVETHDKYFGGKMVDQFWQCNDQQGTLVCAQSCGTGNQNLSCLMIVAGQPNLR